MPEIKVNVKWGKQKLEGVKLDTSEPVELFKAQLYTLTQVPPERQKIMGVKGGAVKDNANWEDLKVKDGQVLMLMGTADTLPEPPAEKTVFVEDLPPAEIAAKNTNPGGLANLGNTCYLNSSLQCLRYIPEVSSSLQKYVGSAANPEREVIFAMRDLVGELERSNAAVEVTPFKFVQLFRTAFPMFAQQAEGGRGFLQQDAEECWSTLINMLSQRLVLPIAAEPSDLGTGQPALLPGMSALRRNLGDMLFGVEMECNYKCTETDAEPAHSARESVRKISCHISDKTAHLYTAVESSLTETIEKSSELLGREAQYTKQARITRLPPYLAVQFVRFAWRKDTAKRAKILRNISFPDVFDARNLCTDGLQAQLAKHNNALEAAEEAAKAAEKKSEKEGEEKVAADPMEVTPAAESSAAAEESVETSECDNKTGMYELFGIITHQGRTAEGGHYVAWVKRDAKKWLVFDDETVAEIDPERIKELYGGGDWHTAYLCLYRKMDSLRLA